MSIIEKESEITCSRIDFLLRETAKGKFSCEVALSKIAHISQLYAQARTAELEKEDSLRLLEEASRQHREAQEKNAEKSTACISAWDALSARLAEKY